VEKSSGTSWHDGERLVLYNDSVTSCHCKHSEIETVRVGAPLRGSLDELRSLSGRFSMRANRGNENFSARSPIQVVAFLPSIIFLHKWHHIIR
jgi:hypothetical protein